MTSADRSAGALCVTNNFFSHVFLRSARESFAAIRIGWIRTFLTPKVPIQPLVSSPQLTSN